MAHFAAKAAKNTWTVHLYRPRACVTVKVVKLRPVILEVVPGSVGVAKGDAAWLLLPEKVEIRDSEGEVIQPVGRFYVSAETLDPYHLITDVWDDPKEGL